MCSLANPLPQLVAGRHSLTPRAPHRYWLEFINFILTICFFIEMVLKLLAFGVRGYIKYAYHRTHTQAHMHNPVYSHEAVHTGMASMPSMASLCSSPLWSS